MELSVFHLGSAVVLFLSFGIAFADSGPVSPPGLFRHLQHTCAGINNSYDCAKAVEADRLKKGIIGVSRNRHDLVINPSASPAVVFADIEKEGSSQGQRYSYVDYFPSIRSHVVYVQYYEGGDFILVNSVSGQKTNVWSIPIASPDSTKYPLTSNNGPPILQPLGSNVLSEQIGTIDRPRLCVLVAAYIEARWAQHPADGGR